MFLTVNSKGTCSMEACSSEEANDAKAKKPDEFHRIGLTLLEIELNWSQA